MRSPTTVFLWEFWTRQRWVLIGGVAWLAAVLGLCHALADGELLGMRFPIHKHAITLMLLTGTAPLLYGLLPLFAYGCDGDIGGCESAFPSRTFTLPLTTQALVRRPMILGAAAGAIVWLLVAAFLFRPRGLEAALWWPAGLAASCLAWVQAMAWRPFGLPGLRIFAAAGVIAGLVALSGLRWMGGFAEAVVAGLLLGTIVPAYLVAVRGVARARRGEQADLTWMIGWIGSIVERFSLRGKRFHSASWAQTWYEWRCFGLGLPVVVALMSLFLAILICVSQHNPRLPTLMRSPILLLAVPLFAGVVVGGNWGNCGQPRSKQAIPPFLATRPMRCSEFVWAKMKAAGLSVGVGWFIVLGVVAAMLLVADFRAGIVHQWNVLTTNLSGSQQVVVAVALTLLLPAMTWRSIASALFIGLTGRTWVTVAGVCAINMVLFAAFLGGFRLAAHPQYQEIVTAAIPLTLAVAAGAKLLLGSWLVRRVVRRGLIEPRLMRRLVIGWILTATALFGLLCWLIPAGVARPPLILAGVVLALPLVRISLAPLALAWNRCR